MGKNVILSVAGSGKTTFIINNLTLEKRTIIISYTIGNVDNIKSRIIKKFGFLPKNIVIYTYFSFLYSFCFQPLFSKYLELNCKVKIKGIIYKPNSSLRTPQSDISYFVFNKKYLYSNRISKLLCKLDVNCDLFSRLEKHFDDLYIDEIQDFGGNDFNFIKSFSRLKLNVVLVGDFYQHTFDTSKDGNVNKNLFSNVDHYISEFKKSGFNVDTNLLSKSYRCTPTICKFISDSLGIEIYSHNSSLISDISEVDNISKINEIIKCDKTIKLFYSEHYKYSIYSNNWGNSKGLDCYYDVCIILNKNSYENYKGSTLSELAPSTKNKLYVACTRSKNNVYFISDANFKKAYNLL
jgi:DNA helicase-2/ATP-dependent DNA helicase PcrA